MAVAENAGAIIGSTSQNLDNSVVSSDSAVPNDMEKSNPRAGSLGNSTDTNVQPINGDQNLKAVFNNQDRVLTTMSAPNGNSKPQMGQMRNGFDANVVPNQQMVVNNGDYAINQMSTGVRNGEDGGESFKRDMRDLEELLSKLNPMAEEFVPSSIMNNHGYLGGGGFGYPNNFVLQTNYGNANGQTNRRVCFTILLHSLFV